MSSCVSCGRVPFDSSPCGGGDQKLPLMCECCHRLGQCSCSASSSRCYVSCERPRVSMDTRTDTRSASYSTNFNTCTSTTRSSSPRSTLLSSSTGKPSKSIPEATTTTTTMSDVTNYVVNKPSYISTSRSTSCSCRGKLTINIIEYSVMLLLVLLLLSHLALIRKESNAATFSISVDMLPSPVFRVLHHLVQIHQCL